MLQQSDDIIALMKTLILFDRPLQQQYKPIIAVIYSTAIASRSIDADVEDVNKLDAGGKRGADAYNEAS